MFCETTSKQNDVESLEGLDVARRFFKDSIVLQYEV